MQFQKLLHKLQTNSSVGSCDKNSLRIHVAAVNCKTWTHCSSSLAPRSLVFPVSGSPVYSRTLHCLSQSLHLFLLSQSCVGGTPTTKKKKIKKKYPKNKKKKKKKKNPAKNKKVRVPIWVSRNFAKSYFVVSSPKVQAFLISGNAMVLTSTKIQHGCAQ